MLKFYASLGLTFLTGHSLPAAGSTPFILAAQLTAAPLTPQDTLVIGFQPTFISAKGTASNLPIAWSGSNLTSQPAWGKRGSWTLSPGNNTYNTSLAPSQDSANLMNVVLTNTGEEPINIDTLLWHLQDSGAHLETVSLVWDKNNNGLPDWPGDSLLGSLDVQPNGLRAFTPGLLLQDSLSLILMGSMAEEPLLNFQTLTLTMNPGESGGTGLYSRLHLPGQGARLASQKFHGIVDTVGPEVTINSLITAKRSPGLAGSVSDSQAVVEVVVGSQALSAVNLRNGSWVLDSNRLSALADGRHSIQVRATDRYGYTRTASGMVTVDGTAPMVQIDTLVTFELSPVLTGSVNDPTAQVRVSLLGVDYTGINHGDGGWELPANTFPPLREGVYDISLTATDSLGNAATHLGTGVLTVWVNEAPQFDLDRDSLTVAEHSSLLYIPAFSDPDGDSLQLSLLDTGWFGLKGDTLHGAPGREHLGNHRVRLRIDDGSLADTLELSILVENSNDAPVVFSWQDLDTAGQEWLEDAIDTFTVVVMDPDMDEVLTLDTVGLPNFIHLLSQSRGDSLHTFEFTVAPLQADTGLHVLKLRFSDAEGESAVLLVKVRVLEVNDPPRAVISNHILRGGAVRLVLDVEDEDGRLEDTRFTLKLYKDESPVRQVDSSRQNTVDFFPLLDGDYSLEITAIDAPGAIQQTPTLLDFNIAGVQSVTLDSGRWEMHGFLPDSLGTELLGANGTAFYWDDKRTPHNLYGKYVPHGDFKTFKQGKGYWVYLKQSVTLAVNENQVRRDSTVLSLGRGDLGWNQISSPFPYPVRIADVPFPIWKWEPDSADMVEVDGILHPWESYWVQASVDTQIVIPPQPFFGDLAPALKRAATFNGFSQWSAKLELRAGKYTDVNNYIGSREGFASPSKFEPPKMGPHVSLFLVNRQWQRISSDIRQDFHKEGEWYQFGVVSEDPSVRQGTLSLPGLENLLEAGLHAYLTDGQSVQKLSAQEDLDVPLTQNVTYYSLVLSENPNLAEELLAPFKLFQNYPNPVSSYTNIKFHLPYTFDPRGKFTGGPVAVRIHLFNLKGEKLDEILSEPLAPGNHQIRWKRPLSLSSGHYIYRVQTPRHLQHKSMTIVK